MDAKSYVGAYDPALAEATLEGSDDDEIAMIACLSDLDALPEGVRVVTRFGDVVTLRASRGRITELVECAAVMAVEAPRRLRASADVNVVDPEDAQWDGETLEDDVESSASDVVESTSYTRRPAEVHGAGKGVVVGVLDWGCDFAHPAFRHEDGSTRLLALWDQRGNDNTVPENRWGYGRILTAQDINQALNESDPYNALDYNPADSGGRKGAHGTHVLDIAAGNSRSGGMIGIAPEADLVFVHLSRTTEVLGKGNLGDSATVLEALDFVFSIAEDRPCVVNMSIGAHGGPHDGSTLVEQGIDRAVLLKKGRAVVNSGGNYYKKSAHTQGVLKKNEEKVIRFRVPSGDPTDSELEVWYPGVDHFTAAVTDSSGAELARVTPGQDSSLATEGKVVGHVYHYVRQSINGNHHIDLFLKPQAPEGTWELRIRGDAVQDGHYHAWIERDRGLSPKFVSSDVVRDFTTGTLCNGKLSITVGACDYQGNLGAFSSAGPTVDGRVKPEIVAPGIRIRAARSTPQGELPGARYVSKSGTSMAAPHVTGAIALMFEAASKPMDIYTTRALLFASSDPTFLANGGAKISTDLHRRGYGYLDITAAEKIAHDWASVDAPSKQDETIEEEQVVAGQDRANVSGVEEVPNLMSFRDTLLKKLTKTDQIQNPEQLYELALSAMGIDTDSKFIPLANSGIFFNETVRPGDLLIRSAPFDGVFYSAVVISEETENASKIANRGVPVESGGAGAYVEVLEVPFGGGSIRSVGRRLTDLWGRLPNGQLLFRANNTVHSAISPPLSDQRCKTDHPGEDNARFSTKPQITGETIDYFSSSRTGFEENIHIDDIAVEMHGLQCKFVQAFTARLSDGTTRAFSVNSVHIINNWNGTATDALIGRFLVTKLVLAPHTERVPAIRLYVVPLVAQRMAVYNNARRVREWRSRESSYRRNRSLWEREMRRLQELLAQRQVIYSRLWVRQMMYNRFDRSIMHWTQHYNRQLNPRPDLDPNIVKSIFYQESKMGTGGRHLMPPPYSWSRRDHHPIRSRFNIGQAIDSWAPQQWLMMREMAPAIFARHGLDTLASGRRWLSMSINDYIAHPTFMTALREFFAHRNGNRNLMGTVDRDLHEDYEFWIRTAIRWLFQKFSTLRRPTWSEAVRAYNGSGPSARRYRDAVMARVGSLEPLRLRESAEEFDDGQPGEFHYDSQPEQQTRQIVSQHSLPAECTTRYQRAMTFQSLINLVRAAEIKLNTAGITSTREQVHALRGIYYGTTWSQDYAVERSTTRNEGFQRFTRPSQPPHRSVPPDVRPILNCGLFEALRASQDITDGRRHVDFGHLIIALDARYDPAFASNIRYPIMFMSIDLGGTGPELVTWLGDLGGGAAALAIRRITTPSTSARTVFTGTDYGGSINLEGDIAGFVVATSGSPTVLTSPTFATGRGRLSDALQEYLSPNAPSAAWINRTTTFLRMYGGIFDASTNALTNRPTLISTFFRKIQLFACNYLASRVRDSHITYATARTAADHVIPASREVAIAFVNALEDSHRSGNRIEGRRFPSPSPSSPGACAQQLRAASLLGTFRL